jgi:hypothetical protein
MKHQYTVYHRSEGKTSRVKRFAVVGQDENDIMLNLGFILAGMDMEMEAIVMRNGKLAARLIEENNWELHLCKT